MEPENNLILAEAFCSCGKKMSITKQPETQPANDDIELFVYIPSHPGITDQSNHILTTPPWHWSMQSSPYRCIAILKGKKYG